MFYREAGQFKTDYSKDMAVFPIRQDRIGILFILIVAFVVIPYFGSNFTLHVDGQLVRVAGRDADAIGKPVPTAVTAQAEDVKLDDVKGLVWETLRTCYDPEIPVDIVELGLVYVCDVIPIDDEQVKVSIKMTLTAPGCGMGDAIANEVAEKVLALPRVAEVNVDMVFDPPWTRYHMSEAARLTLGL